MPATHPEAMGEDNQQEEALEARFDDANPGVQEAAFTAARAVGDLHTAQLLTAKRPSIQAPVLLESLDLAIAAIPRA